MEYMLCDLCGEKFEQGEAMVELLAIGWMHQHCSHPYAELIQKILAEEEW